MSIHDIIDTHLAAEIAELRQQIASAEARNRHLTQELAALRDVMRRLAKAVGAPSGILHALGIPPERVPWDQRTGQAE